MIPQICIETPLQYPLTGTSSSITFPGTQAGSSAGKFRWSWLSSLLSLSLLSSRLTMAKRNLKSAQPMLARPHVRHRRRYFAQR